MPTAKPMIAMTATAATATMSMMGIVMASL